MTGILAFEVAARVNRVDVDTRAVMREYGIHQEVTPEACIG